MTRGSVDDGGDPSPRVGSAERESATEAGVPMVCRYLLIPGSGVRYARPERDHRCLAVRPHESPAQDKQRRLCLTSDHVSCPAFLAARQRRLAMLADSGIAATTIEAGRLRPLGRTTPLILEGGHASLGRARTSGPRDASGAAGRARSRVPGAPGDRVEADRRAASAGPGGRPPSRGWRAMAGPGAAVVVVVAALAVLAARLPGGAPVAADTSPSPSTSVVASASPVLPATPGASVEASPTASSPPSAAATSAPAATPTAAPAQTYRVKAGDTLSAIAARYGVTVADLQQLNNIKDPRFLQIGQVLKIP